MKQGQPQPPNVAHYAPVESPAVPASTARLMDRIYGALMIPAGLGGIGLGIYEYYDLLRWEESGGHKTVHALVMMMYDLGGPLAVAGGMGFIGLLVAAGGVFLLARPRGSRAGR